MNGCKTDNRPGNLMVIGKGPHHFEPTFRQNPDHRRSITIWAFNGMRHTGGLLSSYVKQMIFLSNSLGTEMDPDETSWQGACEVGFWEEGEVKVAGAEQIGSAADQLSKKAAEALHENHPDKEFWMAYHEPSTSPRKVAFSEWYGQKLQEGWKTYDLIASHLGLD